MNNINDLQDNGKILFDRIAGLIETARGKVAHVVNTTIVNTYFEIGRLIVEIEQGVDLRAKYGQSILKDLSRRLTEKFAKGFSVDNLQNMRRFYLTYSKYEKPSRKFGQDISTSFITDKPLGVEPSNSIKFSLSWSHYIVLMKIKNEDERKFYEIEAFQQHWSEPQLKRQYQSSLYERLALSRNKEEVLKLSALGQIVEKSEDLLKNPISLEFLGLEEQAVYTESDLETAIILKLQRFLLEL